MRLIAITPETPFEGEARVLDRLFEAGLDVLHLRHPRVTEHEARLLIEGIDARFHDRIVLHDRFELLDRFALRGIHLNRRNPSPPLSVSSDLHVPTDPSRHISISRSCHSLEELKGEETRGCDYVFLSPVFDSISKPGYPCAFTPPQLDAARAAGTIDERTIALGGVDVRTISLAARYGFGGVAVLGALWGDDPTDRRAVSRRFDHLQNAIL